MPTRKVSNTVDKERVKLAREIAELSAQLTYTEKMTVCIACGIHEDTLGRYRNEVKKVPAANKMIAEMKKILAARGVAVVS